MQRSLNDMRGFSITAKDGKVGHVQDFYFDDEHWTVRYMVADTGHWLLGRLVLISPAALHPPEWGRRTVHVDLSRQEIEDGPGIDSDRTVSRQHEIDLHRHFGWPAYWSGGPVMPEVLALYPELNKVARPDLVGPPTSPRDFDEALDDSHLRSMRSVTGYKIHAPDGGIGHVEDFLIDEVTWRIQYLVADTHDWLPGKQVLVSPEWIKDVSWDDGAIDVTLGRHEIADAPPFHHGMEVNDQYESRLNAYYEQYRATSRVGQTSARRR